MLLYLTVLQMLTLFCTHLLITRTAASIFLVLLMLAITGVGGYVIHIGEIPSYLWWSENLSPQRWLMPIVMADEFSQETLSNTAGQQLCRNKHVSSSSKRKSMNQILPVKRLPFNILPLHLGAATRDYRSTSVSGAEWDKSIGRTLAAARESHTRCQWTRIVHSNRIGCVIDCTFFAHVFCVHHKYSSIVSKTKFKEKIVIADECDREFILFENRHSLQSIVWKFIASIYNL